MSQGNIWFIHYQIIHSVQSTLQRHNSLFVYCLLHPEAELPLYLLGSHLEFLALNGSPSPVDLTKCVLSVVCIIIMEELTARVTLQMSDLVARMARGTATV